MQSIFLRIHWVCSVQWSQQIRAVVLKWLTMCFFVFESIAVHPVSIDAPGFGKDIYNAMVNTDTAAADQGTAPSCGRGKDIENTAESEPVADVSPQPPRIGKDIHNASDSAEGDDYRPPPVLAKKKKKSRRLTGLSDDDEEEEDSGEEYHATE